MRALLLCSLLVACSSEESPGVATAPADSAAEAAPFDAASETAIDSVAETSSDAVAEASSDTKPAGPGDGCEAYVAALLDRGQRCHDPTMPAWVRIVRWERETLACRSALSTAGVTVSDTDLKACALAIDTIGCRAEVRDLTACDFPAGTLSNGTGCETGFQCASQVCQSTSSSRCGTCLAVVPIGGTCGSATTPCVKDALCDSGTMKCVAITTSRPLGAACESKGQCNSLGYCDVASKTCRPRVKAGGSCATAFCDIELNCDATTNTCKAPAVAKASESCGVAPDYLRCASGLTCSGDKCVPIVWKGSGEDCSAAGALCVHPSCNPTTKKCPTVIPDAFPCVASSPDMRCDFGASCEGGKCVLAGTLMCK